jgi:hypothetical protein
VEKRAENKKKFTIFISSEVTVSKWRNVLGIKKIFSNNFFFFFKGDGLEVEKCAQYWPSKVGSTKKFIHVEVTLLSEEIDPKLANTTVRMFHLKGTSLIFDQNSFYKAIGSLSIVINRVCRTYSQKELEHDLLICCALYLYHV